MKRFSVVLVFLFCGIAFSQAENFETGYIDLLKKDIQAEAKKLVDENLELTGDQAKLFWPIYDSYDAALLELSNERLNVIADYMLDFYDLSDEKAESGQRRRFERSDLGILERSIILSDREWVWLQAAHKLLDR